MTAKDKKKAAALAVLAAVLLQSGILPGAGTVKAASIIR